MATVNERIDELRGKTDDIDRAEFAGLYYLNRFCGCDTQAQIDNVINIAGEADKWAAWAAESLVWTARRLRERETLLALRGWGQLREYTGRHGGFLPCQLFDHVTAIQKILENIIAPPRSLT